MDERAPGATFPLARVGFLDFETRGPVDLKRAGATRYATEGDAIVLAWAIGDGPVRTVAVPDFGRPLDWVGLPLELKEHYARVEHGGGIWAAWNAGFDRAVWNYATTGFPEMAPHRIIDVMAQGVTSGLPPDLSAAAVASGSVRKLKVGAELIKLFSLPASTATPRSHPAEWAQFCEYAGGDIHSLRSVFLATRQLSLAEWREYWAMERINERGVAVDLKLIRHAAALAADDRVRSRDELRAVTGDPAMTVDMVKRLTAWLLARLPVDGRAILTERTEEANDEGEVVRPAQYALTRRRVERLIAYVKGLDGPANSGISGPLADVLRVLQIRLYGGSKTPTKFARMLDSHVDGRLYGQYVFNGAGQTGRASSRGVQIHNLARDVLDDEPGVLDAVLAGCDYDELETSCGDWDPVSRKLSLLIRPAFVPEGDNVFVWSDWSQIEARVLPWLAGDDAGARARLAIFSDVDADPENTPDIYTRTAATLSHVPVWEVTKAMRQRGKVAELALGFGGAVGALQSMGANYGLHVPDDEARLTVDRWRAANYWCVAFWEALEEAMKRAMRSPGVPFRAGRVHYVYAPGYLDGSLLCVLPSRRVLTYRAIRTDRVPELDDNDNIVGYRDTLRFGRGHGRVKLWRGMLCENIVQAVAADVLRGTLVRLEEHGWRTRLHTHDEVLLECPEAEAERTAETLRRIMQQGFDWSEGLPLMSEETTAYYYTKHTGSHGL